MNEAVPGITLQQLPLDEVHQRFGAAMFERDGWSVPASYADLLSEYAVVRDGSAGLIDLSSRGRLLVSGSESLQFLNGLITNDMKTLQPDHWMPAAFPNVQGRLLASVRVLNLGSDGFLIDTEAATSEQVLKTVQRFTFAGDFQVEDLMNTTALLTLQGAQSQQIIASVFGEQAAALSQFQVVRANWSNASVTVMRSSHTSEDGFDLFLPAAAAAEVWQALINANARPVGYDALEVLRVEAGQPRYGIDMDETNVVSETGLDDAISFTKGCYIGQEIIARIKYRGHVAKKLTGILFTGQVGITAQAKIRSVDDKEIGRVTSVVYSPRLKRSIALGYVKYDYLAAETEVKVVFEDQELKAKVVELPFVVGGQ